MKNVKITPPEGWIIDKEKSTFEEIVFKKLEGINSLEDVYKLNNTTEKEFNKKWENFEEVDKYSALERMIAKAYNKGWTPNWNDSSEYKYYPYFYMDNFRLRDVTFQGSYSYVPASLCFKNKKDCEEAVSKFLDIFKKSRTL